MGGSICFKGIPFSDGMAKAFVFRTTECYNGSKNKKVVKTTHLTMLGNNKEETKWLNYTLVRP